MPVRILLIVLGLFALGTAPSRAQAPTSKARSPAPGAGWVSVALDPERIGERSPLCWRRETREGYRWLRGERGAQGEWLQGHWQPNNDRPGQLWVPGHPGRDDRWVLGFWRQESIDGFVWRDGYWLSGVWQHGHWSPTSPRPGYTWVHGHVVEDSWQIGRWRASVRAGLVWVPSHWRSGVWMPGFWHVGLWAWGPLDSPIPYAASPEKIDALNRELAKQIVRPRYMASLIAKAARADDDPREEPSDSAPPESGQEAQDPTPAQRAKAKAKKKRASKKVLRRSIRKRAVRRAPKPSPRAKPSARRSGGSR